MARYGYQYETSPRKLEPDYQRPPKKKPTKKSVQNKKISPKKNSKNNSKPKKRLSFEIKFFINSFLIFAMVFAIIACQALVDQRYKEKEKLNKEYAELLASSISSSETSEDIRKIATDYGMQTKSATLIDLGTTDYIEVSTEPTEIENDNFWDKIVNFFENLF